MLSKTRGPDFLLAPHQFTQPGHWGTTAGGDRWKMELRCMQCWVCAGSSDQCEHRQRSTISTEHPACPLTCTWAVCHIGTYTCTGTGFVEPRVNDWPQVLSCSGPKHHSGILEPQRLLMHRFKLHTNLFRPTDVQIGHEDHEATTLTRCRSP